MSQLAEQPGRAESVPQNGQNFERITGHLALEHMTSLPREAQRALALADQAWTPEEAVSLSVLFNEHTEVGDERVEPALHRLRTLLSIYAPDRSNNTIEAVEWESLSQVTGFGLRDHEERLSVAELYELSDIFSEKRVTILEVPTEGGGEPQLMRDEKIVRTGPSVFFDACYGLLDKERRQARLDSERIAKAESSNVPRVSVENLTDEQKRMHRRITTILGAGESSPEKALMLMGHFTDDQDIVWPQMTREAMSHFANNVQRVLHYWDKNRESLAEASIEPLKSGERYILRETVANPQNGSAMPQSFGVLMDTMLAKRSDLTREQLIMARDHALLQLARVAGIRGRG